ncbi:MAG: FAD-dependent oxidoreductase [Verrucomicrobiales bacterium]|nr:FAD-dependent oxidoreductase [Verrucomicrobiales bacterium]
MPIRSIFCCLCFLISSLRAEQKIEADILIAGATESGWAAAIQAARLGVESIVIVHDGKWFGGQYTEQALACVDENKGMDKVGWGVDWHPMRRSFHRSGLFKELMDEIEAVNTAKYGSPMPGKPFHGPSTFRPAEAEAVFRKMIQPWIDSGQIEVFWDRYPVETMMNGNRLSSVKFAPLDSDVPDLEVKARITIDASDWGEVIQLSGAAYECGPDPRNRYGEISAPEEGAFPENEMNPITWAMIVAESEGETPIARPPRFDDRNYPRATHFSRSQFGNLKWDIKNPGMGSILHWPPAGEASKRQLSVYSVRRIVDGFSSLDGHTSILLNYMNGQDYPLERLPEPVVVALEKTEPGASRKNIVEMTRQQREIVFNDAKKHSLGVLYHLQNFVHDSAEDRVNSFRNFHLSSEFGTADNLPPKPYIRESLRLKAMYMMREQDARNRDGETKTSARPRFAEVTYPDGLFAWQFHYDFHRTGRTYLKSEGESGPWIDYHKTNRHTKFLSDRSTFPLRSLIPESTDGLLGAQGNVGYSSIVSAAIRLHDQRVHIGQAAGATAAIALRESVEPRAMPYSRDHLEAVRHALCGAVPEAVPLLLFGFRDLPADHEGYVAINRLASLGILPVEKLAVDFRPDEEADPEWIDKIVTNSKKDSHPFGDKKFTRAEFCQLWWNYGFEKTADFSAFAFPRASETDADGDGIPDRDDALLFTSNDPIVFEVFRPELTEESDGIPPKSNTRFINFEGNESTRKLDGAGGYGWRRSLSNNHRKRNAMSGPRDSFVFTRESDVWELPIENGSHRVTICVGDSGHEQSGQYVKVEGKVAVDYVNTSAGQFYEKTVTVEVKDEKLTVEVGSGKSGSNTCLNWIAVD